MVDIKENASSRALKVKIAGQTKCRYQGLSKILRSVGGKESFNVTLVAFCRSKKRRREWEEGAPRRQEIGLASWM